MTEVQVPPPRLAPTPEVQFVPQVLRRIQQGDIRMPAFQRGFVWKPGQVLELLESIYSGFPVGSVLLWRVENAVLKAETPMKSYLPALPDRYPTTFVLDGLQRISTLHAVFNYQAALHPDFFAVSLDLRRRVFLPTAEIEDHDASIPLVKLFNAKEFIGHHNVLSRLPDGAALIERSIELHSIFQEYLIPIVTIYGRSVSDVVKIFERINNTGTRLSSVDFMRALTWSETFDLNTRLNALSASVERDHGLEVPHETLVKVIAISMGRSPTPEAMVELRTLPAAELDEGVGKAEIVLGRVARLLAAKMHVHSYDLIPYEAQLLGLCGFFREDGPVRSRDVDNVVRWFWTASLNEDMQGRSEFQVARAVDEMVGLRTGDTKRLRGALTLNATAVKERRFRSGTALSSALAGMLAHAGARSLVTGETIDPQGYTGAEASSRFFPVLSPPDVARALGKHVPAGKVIANMIVGAGDDGPVLRRMSAPQLIRHVRRERPADWEDVLASQFIDPAGATAIQKARPESFLQKRADAIVDFSSRFAFPRALGG